MPPELLPPAPQPSAVSPGPEVPFDLLDAALAPARREAPAAASPSAPPAFAEDTDAATNGWHVRTHRSIREIEADTWDAVAGTSAVTRSHAYLSAIETAAVSSCRYFYPVVYAADGQIMALACVYRVQTDFAQLLPRPCQRLVAWLRRGWPRLLRANVIECASPLFAGSSIAVRPGAGQQRVLALIEAAMVRIAREERSALLVIRDFLAHERPALGFLRERGYKCVSNLPLARIRVRWADYDEYLGSMRARYRTDIRRRLRRSREAGREIEILDNFGAEADRWAQQARAIYTRTSGFKRESVNAAYYAAMDDALGPDSRLLVVNHNGQRIAHGMVIFDDDNTVATFFGREPGPPAGEWFLLMNEVIRLGIARGSCYISLGLGSYDAKSIVGADIEPLYVYTRCTIPWLNALIKLVPDLMRQRPPAGRRLFRARAAAGNDGTRV